MGHQLANMAMLYVLIGLLNKRARKAGDNAARQVGGGGAGKGRGGAAGGGKGAQRAARSDRGPDARQWQRRGHTACPQPRALFFFHGSGSGCAAASLPPLPASFHPGSRAGVACVPTPPRPLAARPLAGLPALHCALTPQEEVLLSVCMGLAICNLLASLRTDNAQDYVYLSYFLICECRSGNLPCFLICERGPLYAWQS